MPGVELPFNAAVETDLPEPQGSMKCGTGLVGLRDGGKHSPIAALAEPVQKLRVQLAAAAPPVMVGVDVDPGLGRPPVGGMEIQGMSVRESDCPVVALEDEPPVGVAGSGNAGRHLVDSRDVEFPTHRAVLDIGAVNR